jgi:hypothetical protein
MRRDATVRDMPDIEESIHVDAPAEVVWSLVSDLTRMGEWSPENTGGKWLGGATGPAAGTRFRGTNRKGALRWQTVSTIVEHEEPHLLTWEVKAGPLPIARWSYRIEPDGYPACRVVETWEDKRATWSAKLTDTVLRSGPRGPHNQRNMRATLERLKAAAEASVAS